MTEIQSVVSRNLSLWALLFIVYIGAVWITILHKLQSIERSLRQLEHRSTKGDSPSKT